MNFLLVIQFVEIRSESSQKQWVRENIAHMTRHRIEQSLVRLSNKNQPIVKTINSIIWYTWTLFLKSSRFYSSISYVLYAFTWFVGYACCWMCLSTANIIDSAIETDNGVDSVPPLRLNFNYGHSLSNTSGHDRWRGICFSVVVQMSDSSNSWSILFIRKSKRSLNDNKQMNMESTPTPQLILTVPKLTARTWTLEGRPPTDTLYSFNSGRLTFPHDVIFSALMHEAAMAKSRNVANNFIFSFFFDFLWFKTSSAEVMKHK